MLSRDLIDLVNSGEAVAIVGSGISTEAGVPSWSDLFRHIADDDDSLGRDTRGARALAAKKKFPEAFDLLASSTSREDIHSRVSVLIEQVRTPAKHHERLADFPFRFYVTTNYDHLIERASSNRLVAVGNRGRELRKVSAGSTNIVWHVHGGSGLSSDVSQLVITKADYDDFYPKSNTIGRLQSVTEGYRCVFIGFGFNDEDLIHVLKAVGRFAHSGRPSFAFLAYGDDSGADREHQQRIRSDYNIEVIPYQKRGNDHSELHRLLDAYSPFVIRRSISFGRTPSATPDYAPLSSSLRIQSTLDLGELAALQPRLHQTLIGARVLAHVREHPGIAESELLRAIRPLDVSETAIQDCIQVLRARSLLSQGPNLDLTAEYVEKTGAAQASVEVFKSRFLGSLRSRCSRLAPTLDEPAQARIVDIISTFFEDLCIERGLGVAQNLATSDVQQKSTRAVALLQQLPQRLNRCATRNEAIVVVQVTSDIFTSPSEAEAAFLGLLCQCYFGQHLVGASDRLAEVDFNLIAGTCYILDASVLVCLLAEGTQIQKFTLTLIQDLVRCGAILTTTDLLVDEITEHANWALRLVDKYGELSNEIIDALRCSRGYRTNQFLKGFSLGNIKDGTFRSYISRVLGTAKKAAVTTDEVIERLRTQCIQVVQFKDWVGFKPELYVERDELQREISSRRLDRGSFKHPRQTRAEAEVALLVDHVRIRKLQPPCSTAEDAFFLSSTRVVDSLPRIQRRISLLPEGLAQWLWSSEGTSQRHAELVFEQLLWDLSLEGVEFVDRRTILRKFSGVVEAAHDEIQSAIRDRRDYLVEKYGPDPAKAFSDVDPLDIPWLAKDVQRAVLDRMERELIEAKKSEREARAVARVAEKDQGELSRLRTEHQERRRKALRKKRAAESRKGKRKGKKKKR